MTDRSATDEGLHSIWTRAIMPLLEEQFYNTRTDVAATFGLAALLRAITPSVTMDIDLPGSDADLGDPPPP